MISMGNSLPCYPVLTERKDGIRMSHAGLLAADCSEQEIVKHQKVPTL